MRPPSGVRTVHVVSNQSRGGVEMVVVGAGLTRTYVQRHQWPFTIPKCQSTECSFWSVDFELFGSFKEEKQGHGRLKKVIQPFVSYGTAQKFD